MKILGISCSPRRGKNTETLLNEALRGAEQDGAQTEFFSVIGKDIRPCDGCWSCSKNGECHIDDDMQPLYQKLKEATGIIIGTPVYFFDVSAQAKTIIDRTLAMQPFGKPLANKVGGMVIAAGSTGTSDALKCLSNFLWLHRIFPVNWVAVYSPVHEKKKGMKAAYDLGREMIQFANNMPEFPPDFSPNHITYGTHTH